MFILATGTGAPPVVGYNCKKRNPCKTADQNTGFYFPHLDKHKFVQCSEHGDCYEMDCPAGLVWNDGVKNCTP